MPVESSAVASAGYEASHRILEIEFKTKGVYDYYEVPPYVFEDLLQAESVGAFVNSEVKPFYRFRKVA